MSKNTKETAEVEVKAFIGLLLWCWKDVMLNDKTVCDFKTEFLQILRR